MARWIGIPLALVAIACAGEGAAGEPRRGTVDRLAGDLAESIRAAVGSEAPMLDVVASLRGGPPKLRDDLAALLRGALERAGFRSAEAPAAASSDPTGPAGPAAAGLARRGVDLIADLTLEIGRDGARLEGNLIRLASSPWRDEPTALRHLHVAAPLDAELRAYAPGLDPSSPPPIHRPVGPLQSRAHAIGDLPILALDAADLDGDGRAELAAVTPDEAIVWRFDAQAQRFVELRRVRFPGRLAATRPRADLATVALDGGEVRARSSRYETGVRFRLLLAGATAADPSAKVDPLAGFPLPGIGATCQLESGVDWFRDAGCAPLLPLPRRFHAASGLRGAAGHAPVYAAVDPERILSVWIGAAAKPALARGAGAQLALADLPRGDVIATSDGVDPGAPDALIVRALTPALPVLGRLERLPGAVVALAAGDLDGDGHSELIAAIRDRASGRTELWIVY